MQMNALVVQAEYLPGKPPEQQLQGRGLGIPGLRVFQKTANPEERELQAFLLSVAGSVVGSLQPVLAGCRQLTEV